MDFLSAEQVSGNKMVLKQTDPRHFAGVGLPSGKVETGDTSFEGMMFEALNGVNRLQQERDNIAVKIITDPDSVSAHDVTIAIAKANQAFGITKAVVDRGLRAYQEILSIR